MKSNLDPTNGIKLFTDLPRQFDQQPAAIEDILKELKIGKLTDEKFDAMYQRVRERLVEDSDQSDIGCIDCYRPFELIPGASNARCKRCNQIHLSKMGRKDDWRTWVYGGAENPGNSRRHP